MTSQVHPHRHNHGWRSHSRAFAIGIVLNGGYVLIEAGFGFASGSLALLADAGHNLSDVLGLSLAWGGAWLSSTRPTPQRTYGYRRASILAALANGVLLLVAVGLITIEAVHRLFETAPVPSTTILWVAAAGLVVNGITAWMFMAGRDTDINIKGVFLHMAADTGVTAGVIVAALIIMFTGWNWADPAVALAIAAVILAGSWDLLRDSVNLSLDAVPADIDGNEVKRVLSRQDGVTDVHDLHVWAMSTTETALTAHLVRSETTAGDRLLDEIRREMRARFGIRHVTIQLEAGNPSYPCPAESLG